MKAKYDHDIDIVLRARGLCMRKGNPEYVVTR